MIGSDFLRKTALKLESRQKNSRETKKILAVLEAAIFFAHDLLRGYEYLISHVGLHLFYGFIYFSETKKFFWMRIFFFFFFEHRKKGICAAFKVDAAVPENLIPFFFLWPYIKIIPSKQKKVQRDWLV